MEYISSDTNVWLDFAIINRILLYFLQENNGKKVRLPDDELQKRIRKLESEE